MSTESFHRHTRRCLDAATRRAFASLRGTSARRVLAQLLAVVHARSDLLRTPPARDGSMAGVEALVNLTRFHRRRVAEIDTWPGARGHPLVVVASLAGHLLGRYPVPRFLASVWFGADTRAARVRRRWFVEHARGRRLRGLALPIALTRRMEHELLRSPDHLSVEHALRRAEVLGLGGSPALAGAVVATRLGEAFADGPMWRAVIGWMVRHEDELDPARVTAIVDFVEGTRHRTVPVQTADRVVCRPFEPAAWLRGRGVASVMRAVERWHGELARPRTRALVWTWAPSRWRGLRIAVPDPDPRQAPVVWIVVELLDSTELTAESRDLHHCVKRYTWSCLVGRSTIWSVRRRCGPPATSRARPVLTVEVDPRTATIVQVSAFANRRATGVSREIVLRWAAQERFGLSPRARWQLGMDPA